MGAVNGRTGFKVLAYMFAGIGALGVVLPLLPTTPFLLLAAFCASRGAPEFAIWLDTHPTLGPTIANWRERQAVPRPAKVCAICMLGISWFVLFLSGAALMPLAGLGVFFIGLSAYLSTRPSY